MSRILFLLVLSAMLSAFPRATGLDWPVRLNFQLGFNLRVIPAKDDASSALGLVIATDKIVNDKKHTLVVTGTITNYSGLPRDDLAMRFAVSSYVGTGSSFGVATVEPPSLPPGGTARFSAHISLNDPKPRHAMYTLTSSSGIVAGDIHPAPQ